jgi:hypothetical protein
MKVLRILGAIFGLVGAGLLAAAIVIYAGNRSFEQHARRAAGHVVSLEPSQGSDRSLTYLPIVQFTAEDGRTIEFSSGVSSNPPAYDVGEEVSVLYDPAKPTDAKIDAFWQVHFVTVVLGGIGSLFFIVGAGLILTQMVSRRRRERLQAMGRRITTQIQGVDLDTSVRVNDRHPFCITSQWLNPDTGQMHVFRSEGLWYDPTDLLTGETIDVLIDPSDPKKYYVDVSFLPKEA